MEFTFAGSFDTSRKPAEVYAFLADPRRFAPLLPDFESVEAAAGGDYTVKLRVGISHIWGTAAIRLRVAEADPPRHAAYEGKGDIPGGVAVLRAGFDLEPAGAGSRVNWTGRAQISGKLLSLAGGLLEPLARKNLEKLIEGLKAALA
ncbi:MAG TPA: SRPBCC domain-containing protein [Candidatus Acidoferrales bacterium]|nr:SRPBCC domain-containing protein [Candidatus Acidoferrales bacterium]